MAAAVGWRSWTLGALLLSASAVLGVAGDWERAAAQDRGRAVAITVGSLDACALLDSSAVECWGSGNYYGQMDAPGGRVSAVYSHTCGLRDTSVVECWGSSNHYGQMDAPDGRVSAVYSHTCGLREAGEVEC